MTADHARGQMRNQEIYKKTLRNYPCNRFHVLLHSTADVPFFFEDSRAAHAVSEITPFHPETFIFEPLDATKS